MPDFPVHPIRHGPNAVRRSRPLLITLTLSIGLHLAAGLTVAFQPSTPPRQLPPPASGTVELLLVEAKGAKPVEQDKTSGAAPPQPENQPQVSESLVRNRQEQAAVSRPVRALPVQADGVEKIPPAAEDSPRQDAGPETQQVQAPPTPPKTKDAPVFDLAGTESESNAVVLGGHVLPAMPDDRYRNRPPIYPREAESRGEHGTVLVVIHVSETGRATGVDVIESSGVSVLDQATVNAVRKWHFRPAMQGGHAIPFDMPFRFVFDVS